jgi:ABC-type antimicrobial peptide transport system permease subunit
MITERSRDIAVRMALGARQDDVVRMIVWRALVLYAIGLSGGLVGVIWCGHLLSGSALFHCIPEDLYRYWSDRDPCCRPI